MASDKKNRTLSDRDIVTGRHTGRRGFIGLMAAGGAAGVTALAPAASQAQSVTDSDNGEWTDFGGCGRGSGGYATGFTDADDGSAGTDLPGSGRGAPYC